MIYYAVAIHKDETMNNYAGIIPDVPGCYTFGDTLDELLLETKEAIESHIETTLDSGLKFEFKTTPLEDLQKSADFKNAMAWFFVAIDETLFDKQIRFNVSWSERLLQRVDEYIAHTHDTRSGFLAKAATLMMAKD
ncbi:MAG: type II toxin-antitoxin system HicB family antitoxin [Pelistega sp.]|nr:type II toxin-antitoxin system HicB family antitoxin [Pelistega sp.]